MPKGVHWMGIHFTADFPRPTWTRVTLRNTTPHTHSTPHSAPSSSPSFSLTPLPDGREATSVWWVLYGAAATRQRAASLREVWWRVVVVGLWAQRQLVLFGLVWRRRWRDPVVGWGAGGDLWGPSGRGGGGGIEGQTGGVRWIPGCWWLNTQPAAGHLCERRLVHGEWGPWA